MPDFYQPAQAVDVAQVVQRVDVRATESLVNVACDVQHIDVEVAEQRIDVLESRAPSPSEGVIRLPVGETIHGLRAVRAADGQLFQPDPATPAHASQVLGIALQSALAGDVAVRTRGAVTEPSWSWAPGFVFVGAGGQLTQSPVGGWLLSVGRAISPTTIDVDIDTPFMRF